MLVVAVAADASHSLTARESFVVVAAAWPSCIVAVASSFVGTSWLAFVRVTLASFSFDCWA